MTNSRNNGVTFETLNDDDRRSRICSYGYGAPYVNRSKAKSIDIAGLKNEDKRNIITNPLDDDGSRFTIGFEVEKNRFHRNALKEYPLFARFEKDGSCGYEAITHILPLVGRSMWRTKVYNMFVEARQVIEDEFSPSNSLCGGHMHLACAGMDSDELFERVRRFSGIVYSIYRKRLGNFYCKKNQKMEKFCSEKYVPCRPNAYGVEFRLPSRVQSVKQMMRRYELMYVIMDFACNTPLGRVPAGTMARFRNALKPILMSMYERDSDKVKNIMDLAGHFQKYLTTGKVTWHTIGWLEARWSSVNREVGRCEPDYVRGLEFNFDYLDWMAEQEVLRLL
jgi:hypothetical protein